MKFSKLSQLFLVSMIGLLVATCLTACQLVTIDYVFLASNASSGSSSDGQIQAYAVDSESGALRTANAAADSGGASPSSMATTSDYANLYVANQGNNSVVHFAIASDGALTKKDTVTLAAAPVAIAVDAAGKNLYVASGTTSATLTDYALSSGAIGSVTSQQTLTVPGNAGDVLVPTGVTTLPNNDAVYVTAYDQSSYNPGGSTTSTANPGWIFGFVAGSALTPTSGSPYKAGVKPSGLVADPTNRFVYVTDFASNQMIGYALTNTTELNFLQNGPFKTGNEPSAIAIDPRGKYLYVSNALDSTVSAYAIDLATGTPSAAVSATGATSNATDTNPVAIVVDPALGRFVLTANYLGNSISGFKLNPNSGVLTSTQATPYPTGPKPTAIVCVPHGNHSLENVAP
jgi:6-phosphogluconolactonase (cycloisomerase 2 family)